MDKQIITLLQERSLAYEKEFEKFPYKQDPAAVFEHECIYYLEPLSKFVLPLLARRLQEHKNEKVTLYLPYILERYHDAVIKELDTYKNGEDSFGKKAAKEILNHYASEVMNFQKANEEQKNSFIVSFVERHHVSFSQIASRTPHVALQLLATLRTPKLQHIFLKKDSIANPIKDLLQNKMLKEDWSLWLDQYFCYPRTDTMEEYMKKWIGRERIHVKIAKPLFGMDYEQAKIWLKNKEKMREKQGVKAV